MARKAKSVDQTDTSSTSSTSPTDIGPTLQAAGTAAPDLQAAPGTAPDPQAAPTGGAAPLTLAGQFMRLFKGADRSSGTHNPNVKAAPGKVKVEIKGKGGARTVKEPVTEALWQAHLDGKRPLGVVTIREDDTCLFAAIDIDDYTVDHKALVKALNNAKIPAFVCRTKSGGAHVYIFFSEPIPAAVVIPRLRELATMLGYGTHEIFPKQTTVNTKAGDFGSWINMPYFAAATTDRYWVMPNGHGETAERFVKTAWDNRITRKQFETLELTSDGDGDDGDDGSHEIITASGKKYNTGKWPPCLAHLAKHGFEKGNRNNGLLALGVMAKKQQPGDFAELIREYNRELKELDIPHDEVKTIIKNLKKDYRYKCSGPPIHAHCNAKLCRKRGFGVGSDGDDIIESVDILLAEKKIYRAKLKMGGTVEAEWHQLDSPRLFRAAAADQLRIATPITKTDFWDRMVARLLNTATETEAPKDIQKGAEFFELLTEFVTQRGLSENQNDIVNGNPWHDDEKQRVVFRLKDIKAFLSNMKFMDPKTGRPVDTAWIVKSLHDLGGKGDQTVWVVGKNRKCWALPSSLFDFGQKEPLPLPKHDDPPI